MKGRCWACQIDCLINYPGLPAEGALFCFHLIYTTIKCLCSRRCSSISVVTDLVSHLLMIFLQNLSITVMPTFFLQVRNLEFYKCPSSEYILNPKLFLCLHDELQKLDKLALFETDFQILNLADLVQTGLFYKHRCHEIID